MIAKSSLRRSIIIFNIIAKFYFMIYLLVAQKFSRLIPSARPVRSQPQPLNLQLRHHFNSTETPTQSIKVSLRITTVHVVTNSCNACPSIQGVSGRNQLLIRSNRQQRSSQVEPHQISTQRQNSKSPSSRYQIIRFSY
jgi:hypothetical protein